MYSPKHVYKIKHSVIYVKIQYTVADANCPVFKSVLRLYDKG